MRGCQAKSIQRFISQHLQEEILVDRPINLVPAKGK